MRRRPRPAGEGAEGSSGADTIPNVFHEGAERRPEKRERGGHMSNLVAEQTADALRRLLLLAVFLFASLTEPVRAHAVFTYEEPPTGEYPEPAAGQRSLPSEGMSR